MGSGFLWRLRKKPRHRAFVSSLLGSRVIAAEFIAELESVGDSFAWSLRPAASHAPERRAVARRCIRGTPKDGSSKVVFEPIGAVCYLRTGLAYDAESWLEAAQALGLSLIDAGDLTAAANDITWRWVDNKRQPQYYLESLRQRIAYAVNLDI